jgi:hypothetical protein
MKKIACLLVVAVAILSKPDGGKAAEHPPTRHPKKTIEQTIQDIIDLAPKPK